MMRGPGQTQLDRIEEKVHDIDKRLAVVEAAVCDVKESRRHWGRWVVGSLFLVGTIFLSAYVGAQFAIG